MTPTLELPDNLPATGPASFGKSIPFTESVETWKPYGDITLYDKRFDKLSGRRHLPQFLELRGGTIFIRGHRISLFTFMKAERKNENLPQSFPTLTCDQIAKLSWYCKQHALFLTKYYEQQQAIEDRNRIKYGVLPSADDLRARLAAIKGTH